MAKILCWNVPEKYHKALIKEADRLTFGQGPPYGGSRSYANTGLPEILQEILRAVKDRRPYTQLVVFQTDPEMDPEKKHELQRVLEVVADFSGADLLFIAEEIPLPDFIAEFKRTFHLWKKCPVT
jgi:hypothetical protein